MCIKSTVSAHGRGLNAIISRQRGQVYPWGNTPPATRRRECSEYPEKLKSHFAQIYLDTQKYLCYTLS